MQEIIPMGTRRWVRSRQGVLMGVCTSLARHLGVEPWIVRGVWALAVACFGVGLLPYVVLGLCLPREDRVAEYETRKVLGVCLRVSRRSGKELALVRLLAVLAFFVSAGTAAIVYGVLHLAMPKSREPEVIYL